MTSLERFTELKERFRTLYKKRQGEFYLYELENWLNEAHKCSDEIVIEPSGRIDYCCECDSEHGYDCPTDAVKPTGIFIPPSTKGSQFRTDGTSPHTCSPDKAFMRVVEKCTELDTSKGVGLRCKNFIQQICPVDGKILSEVEIKNK